VADGTYVVSTSKVWGAKATPEGTQFGTAGPAMMVLAGTNVQTVTTGASSLKVTRRSGTVAYAGTNATFTLTCENPTPDAGLDPPGTVGYSVVGGALLIYAPLGTATLETTYTKQ
jgi:hypothetical protein